MPHVVVATKQCARIMGGVAFFCLLKHNEDPSTQEFTVFYSSNQCRNKFAYAVVLTLAFFAIDSAAADPRRAQTQQMVYISNGEIRLGVDLNAGGAIAHLSGIADGRNLVNRHDLGRYIQMSHYAGPVPYEPTGKRPLKHWRQLGWNPIQAGDAFDNRSTVLSHRVSQNSIYVQTRPLHWPLDNEPAQATYELTATLEENRVRLDCRARLSRDHRKRYPPRDQELPAVYVNGAFFRLMSYRGSRPFRFEPMETLPPRPDAGDFPWNRFCATEGWAAFVDRNGFGLGVVSPITHDFLGGFSGKPGAGRESESPTGYIAPVSRETLDHDIVYPYQTWLVVGQAEETRAFAARLRQKWSASGPRFDFQQSRANWHSQHAKSDDVQTHWSLSTTSRTSIRGPVRTWRARPEDVVMLEFAVSGGSGPMALSWRSPQGEFNPQQRTTWRPIRDGKTHLYRISLGSSGAYSGTFSQFQLEFGESDAVVELQSIRLERH